LSAFAFGAGAIGVGIGFGLQKITKRFIMWFNHTFEAPIRKVDRIEVGDCLEMYQISARFN